MAHVSKMYEGDTPEIIAVLGLQNENVDKKVSLTVFCERIGTYIMKEYTNGEDVITVTKDMDLDIIEEFKKEQKSVASTNEEKISEVDVEIKKEEIKTYVRHLKILESNMKKPYSPVFDNCTDGARNMFKSEELYEQNSICFDSVWIFKRCNSIISGIDTKVEISQMMRM